MQEDNQPKNVKWKHRILDAGKVQQCGTLIRTDGKGRNECTIVWKPSQ